MGDGERVEREETKKIGHPDPEVEVETPTLDVDDGQSEQMAGLGPVTATGPQTGSGGAGQFSSGTGPTPHDVAVGFYEKARARLRTILKRGVKHTNRSVANACEYLLESDERWAPGIVFIGDDELREEVGRGTRFLVLHGSTVTRENIYAHLQGYGRRLRDGTDRIVVMVQVNGRGGPHDLDVGSAGKTEDQILSTVSHEVQHVLDGSRQPNVNELDVDGTLESFKTEFRAYMMSGTPEAGTDPSLARAHDVTARHDKEGLDRRKKETLEWLVRPKTEYQKIRAAYVNDESFKKQADDFVEQFRMSDEHGEGHGEYSGGMNLINSPRLAELEAAVAGSTLQFIGQSGYPYDEYIPTLDSTDVHFLKSSKDWEQYIDTLLEDPSRFWKRVNSRKQELP